MSLLLDTNAILWFVAGATELRADARNAIEAADEAFVSAASIWEIAVKHARGRLEAPANLGERLHDLGS